MKYIHILDRTAPPWVKDVAQDITKFYADVGVEVTHEYISWDFTNMPTEIYYATFPGISHWYIKMITDMVFKKYGYSVDRVNLWVSDKNWSIRDFVWGWNMGVTYNGYDVHQCRIADLSGRTLANMKANTFGTLYHEGQHANGHFADRYDVGGMSVEQLVNTKLKLSQPVTNWQSDIVHGEHPDFDYIRFDNNKDALKAISRKLAFGSYKRREKEGIDDLAGRQRVLAKISESLAFVMEQLSHIKAKHEVMHPLTDEEQKVLEEEYKAIAR